MISTIIRFALSISIIALCGCSTFQPDKQTLKLNCEYPDTSVLVNGVKSPCPSSIEVNRKASVQISANKPGYMPYERNIGRHLSSTGTLDLVGVAFTFFSGFGLLSPGAWDFDETEITIGLSPVTTATNNSEVVQVKVIGYSHKTGDRNIKLDSQRAMIDAKIKAIEKAGVKIESITTVSNLELLSDVVESKAKGILLPGFEFVEFGYDENGAYKVLLIGSVQSIK